MRVPRHSNGRPTSEYETWVRIRQRCGNPRHHHFRYYGGRGIRVCKRWQVFANFLADMGRKPTPKHSLDRRNNDGHYTRRNCRWALPTVQSRNSRHCHMLTVAGVTRCLAEWAEVTGINAPTIRYRLRRGLPPLAPATATPRIRTR